MDELSDPDYQGGSGRWIPVAKVKDIVAAAHYQIHKHGFVSNATASYSNKMSTSHDLNCHFNPGKCPPSMTAKEWHDMNNIPFTKENEAAAEKIIEWMRNHPKNGKDEFFTNVSKLASNETVPLRYAGYLAAATNQKIKDDGETKKNEPITKSLKSESFAKVGEKILVKGTILSAFSYQSNGQWGGTRYVFSVQTDSGHLIKMFTSGGDSSFKKGVRVEISGKVGSVDPETYDKSPFVGVITTTMAPRAHIESLLDDVTADKHYHVGMKIKFTGADGKGKIGMIVAKPVFGKFEIESITKPNAPHIHISYEDIISPM
jgi:hypothetical protein